MSTEELIEKAKAGEVWFWSTGLVEDGDNAFTLVCPIIIQPEDMKKYQTALDASIGFPVRMILHCPRCWFQHIDRPEEMCGEVVSVAVPNCICTGGKGHTGSHGALLRRWSNPPHKTHKCLRCHHEWRPALISTVGVETL